MSKTPREQKHVELKEAIGHRDDYQKLVRLRVGQRYQGQEVTAGKIAIWRDSLDKWQRAVNRLQREYDAMPSDRKKSGKRPR